MQREGTVYRSLMCVCESILRHFACRDISIVTFSSTSRLSHVFFDISLVSLVARFHVWERAWLETFFCHDYFLGMKILNSKPEDNSGVGFFPPLFQKISIERRHVLPMSHAVPMSNSETRHRIILKFCMPGFLSQRRRHAKFQEGLVIRFGVVLLVIISDKNEFSINPDRKKR